MRNTATARRLPRAPHAPVRGARGGENPVQELPNPQVTKTEDNTIRVIRISPTDVKVIYR